jgi:hypothetical protein
VISLMADGLRIGMLGSGSAGQTLASSFLSHDHPVMIGSRDPSKLHAWQEKAGPGKILLDASDPLDFFSGRPGPFVGTTDSLGERIQLPETRVVKGLNTLVAEVMVNPRRPALSLTCSSLVTTIRRRRLSPRCWPSPTHRGPGPFLIHPGSGGAVPSLQVARCGHTRRTDRALASDLLMQ